MPLSVRDVDLPASQVLPWVRGERISVSLNLCVATAIVYDFVITIDKEDRKLSFAKVVFFLNRYIGIVGAVLAKTHRIRPSLCAASGWIPNTSNTITIISIDYVLTIRVLALYQSEKKMTMVLYIVWALEAIGKSVVVILGMRLNTAAVAVLFPHWATCGYSDGVPSSIYITDWIIPLANAALLVCLALFKGRQFWKLNGYNGSRLVEVLIRDQAFYFVLVISSSATNILSDRISRNLIVNGILSTLGATSFLCILGSHMFFNLKEAAEHGVNVGTNWASYSHSAIHFDGPAGSHQDEEADAASPVPVVLHTQECGSDIDVA